MAKGVPRMLVRIVYRLSDGLYDYHLTCGHVIVGPGRVSIPATMRCKECEDA